MQKTFPKGFYWGAATASYQVEGGIENCDWAKAARDGRVPPCGRACDHYHRYEEDFDLAKSLGHNAHRFSIEWARIEPEEGKFDESAFEHYRKVLKALHARGIKPYITLWHFTLPQWFADRGGFERSDAPQIFARYCALVVSRLSDLCDSFSTMNEPNVYASLGWLKGMWPPFQKFGLIDLLRSVTASGDLTKAKPTVSFGTLFRYLRVAKNLARAHNAAYKKIKMNNPNVEVSLVKHVIAFSGTQNPWYKLKAWLADYTWNHIFLRRTYRCCDAIGINFYHDISFGDRTAYKKTDMGWDFKPEGIYHALATVWRYRKPMFISEAGIADEDDSDRAEYIRKQVRALWQAIDDGMMVQGHMYWSLLDNYEWAFGFGMRFGLVAINYDTLERTVRPSAYVYKEICDKNAVIE
jgi:beta-glucosidase